MYSIKWDIMTEEQTYSLELRLTWIILPEFILSQVRKLTCQLITHEYISMAILEQEAIIYIYLYSNKSTFNRNTHQTFIQYKVKTT